MTVREGALEHEPLMTAKEAAAYLKVHPVTLYVWHRDGKISAERAGRNLRFRKSDLDAWLKRDVDTPAAT